MICMYFAIKQISFHWIFIHCDQLDKYTLIDMTAELFVMNLSLLEQNKHLLDIWYVVNP